MSERTAPARPAAAPEPSGTLRELTRRRLLLLVLVALTTASLFHAYRGVHADAVPLRSAGAPGVLAVDTAMDALARAQQGVERGEGTTGDFHTRLSVANQSLARAAAADVTGLTGRQTLQTVTGLITTYSGWIEDAAGQPTAAQAQATAVQAPPASAGPGRSPAARSGALRTAYLDYARSVLGTTATGPAADATVLGRLRDLQAAQQRAVRGQTDFGPLLWLEWTLALALALALLVLLTETHRFLAGRFRRRWNPAVAGAALLLVAGAAVLVVFTALTHSEMAGSRAVLSGSLTGDAIPRAGARVSGRLAGTGFRAAAADWILVGGLLLAGLVLQALQPRINEYRVRVIALRWPRPRTLGVLGLSLALLAGGGVVAVRAAGWNGSVTLLANWTGTEQDQFQQKVIDRFEHEYRIHVVYQGSSAESEVLAADVESGTPPDVAVLPGPGELAGYAVRGMLTPLDDMVRPADFASAWVTPVKGHTYWLPIKTDLKSMVWHPRALDTGAVERAAKSPASWCLGMGADATSGWPGSDWIEDILLQQTDPATYSKWVAGSLPWTDDRVRRAWTTWGDLVGAGRAAAGSALGRSFGDAADGVLQKPPACRLEHQSSFARGSGAWTKTGAAYVPSADVIPGAAAGSNRWEVSGDLAALLHSTPQSRKLIGYLASDEAQRAWASTQSGFSVEHTVLADPRTDPNERQIVRTLRDPKAVRCYDASDAMPPTLRDAFARAVLRFLADPATLTEQLGSLDRTSRSAGKVPLTSVCSSG
ncbi:ABC transporter substrate-binding protein [Streptomyces sp. IBSBF 2435]|uniref:ABC transporter substrate-binding protein n=1 Tax=Streptomyces sp. IBSBF 2435 TaxID=2903531 RepID=UPI002FDBDD9C